jgi:ribosome recycling factor
MTISEAYCEAMDSIHEVAKQFWDGKLTSDEARQQQEAIMDAYDDQVNRIRSAELAKHTHDFSMP